MKNTSWVIWVALAASAAAQSFTTLALFNGTNGTYPNSALIQSTDGTFVGATKGGGYQNYGALYRVTASGMIDDFYSFCRQARNCPDGALANGVLMGSDGNFYGTTSGGGKGSAGTIFEITPNDVFTTLLRFNGSNGAVPSPGALFSDGNFYGTTGYFGAYSDGTVYQLTAARKLTTLYNFSGIDGNNPIAAPLQGSDGKLYGTTLKGGLYGEWGTIFRINETGKLTTLHSFCAVITQQGYCADGGLPDQLIQASDGNLYGTTKGGGIEDCYNTSDGCGTIYRLTPTGTFTTLYNFCAVRDGNGQCLDGALPGEALLEGTDGNFYGVTAFGGTGLYGTIFQITKAGVLTTLYNFCTQTNCADGSTPYGALLQGTDGDFYGTTPQGGQVNQQCNTGCGTIFRLSMGLAPFVKSLPTAAKVGKRVGILGTDLTGATRVTFNGTAASFKVVSASLIKTTVPAGATTGPIQVTLPNGVLQSNVPFVVVQ